MSWVEAIFIAGAIAGGVVYLYVGCLVYGGIDDEEDTLYFWVWDMDPFQVTLTVIFWPFVAAWWLISGKGKW